MPGFPVCPAVGHMGEFGRMGTTYVYGILQWGGGMDFGRGITYI